MAKVPNDVFEIYKESSYKFYGQILDYMQDHSESKVKGKVKPVFVDLNNDTLIVEIEFYNGFLFHHEIPDWLEACYKNVDRSYFLVSLFKHLDREIRKNYFY